MARTVSQAFQEFIQKYEPSPYQRGTIARHHNYIRGVIANKVDVIEDFLTGSYIKRTQIKPPTDIDLFIVLHPKYAQSYCPNKANKLLNDFKRLLLQTYPYSLLKSDGQAVITKFSDDIKMDVVPAFQRRGGGYLIPNVNTNTFISTDPNSYNALLSNANQALDGKLIPIIKMLKCWNVTRRNLLRSLHIEVLSLNCFCDLSQNICYPFENYPEGLEIFFGKAKNSINNHSYDPIVGDRIDGYLNHGKRAILRTYLKNHHNKILEAIQFQKIGYHKKAIETWNKLFGGYFPSYY